MTTSTFDLEAREGPIIYGPGRLSITKLIVQKSSLLERLQNNARIVQSLTTSDGKYRVYMLCHDGYRIVRDMLFWMPIQEFLEIDEDDFLEVVDDMKSRSRFTFLSIEEPNTVEAWVDIFVQNEGRWELILPTSSSDQTPLQHTFFEGNLGASIIQLAAHKIYRLEVPCRMKVTVYVEFDRSAYPKFGQEARIELDRSPRMQFDEPAYPEFDEPAYPEFNQTACVDFDQIDLD